MTGESPIVTCDIFSRQLMDFLEGDVDGATRAAMEAHARECAECGMLLGDLRRVSDEASRLPALAPSRDLWSGIAARLETPVVPLVARHPRWRSPRMITAGLAATLVLAVALGYETARRGGPPVAPSAPTDAGPAVLAGNRAANATPAAVERSYDAEIAGLRAVLDARRSQLDTATIGVIEKNLAVIDSAIAQCRTALGKDSASRYLMQSLSQSLDTKVRLLRIAAALPAST